MVKIFTWQKSLRKKNFANDRHWQISEKFVLVKISAYTDVSGVSALNFLLIVQLLQHRDGYGGL